MARASDALRHLARSAGLSMLAACSEGYPTHDEPLFEPFRMSQAERILHLQEMGRSKESDGRWHYQLAAGCVLIVERKTGWRDTSQVRVSLAQVTLALEHDKPKKVYRVVALPPQARSPIPLFASSNRFDASRADTLIKLLARDCSAPPHAERG